MLRVASVVLILTSMMGSQAMALTLAANGKSSYAIVVATDAIAPEQTAAKELQSHLKLVTGAELPITTEAAAPAGKELIFVGQTAAFKAAFPNEDLASLKHDGIIMRTAGERLYLLGGQPRGTLYAVYTFLEDIVGVHWWGARPDETFIPKQPTLDILDLNKRYVPALQCREAFYRLRVRRRLRRALQVQRALRARRAGVRRPLQHPRLVPHLLPAPAAGQVLQGPPGVVQRDQRQAHLRRRAALPDQRRDARRVDEAGAGMAAQGPERRHDLHRAERLRRSVPVRQVQGMVAEEGSESGPVIRFVNAVAADIEKEFPGTFVETLAYQYTRRPPKLVKPRSNVMVRLCSIEASSAQPLESGAQNESFRQDIEGWCAIAPQLYIWNYVTDFANYIIPHPNLRVLGPDIRYFVNHKCIGLFEQGDSGCSFSDFPELRAWLIAHLMWDPSQDDQALIAEFMKGYYGAAAEPLLEYMTLLQDRLTKAGAYLPCYMQDTSPWMNLTTANKATELFNDAAARVKDDPVLSARVRRARLPLDHNWIQRYKSFKRLADMTGAQFLGPNDPAIAVGEFIKTCNSFDAGQFREGAPFAGYEPCCAGCSRRRARRPRPPRRPKGSDRTGGWTSSRTSSTCRVWATGSPSSPTPRHRMSRPPGCPRRTTSGRPSTPFPAIWASSANGIATSSRVVTPR